MREYRGLIDARFGPDFDVAVTAAASQPAIR